MKPRRTATARVHRAVTLKRKSPTERIVYSRVRSQLSLKSREGENSEIFGAAADTAIRRRRDTCGPGAQRSARSAVLEPGFSFLAPFIG